MIRIVEIHVSTDILFTAAAPRVIQDNIKIGPVRPPTSRKHASDERPTRPATMHWLLGPIYKSLRHN